MMSRNGSADFPRETESLAESSFHGLDDSIGFFARIAFWRFVRAVEKRLSPFNISVGQYVVLRYLRSDDGIAQHQLGVKLKLCEPAIAVTLRKLEDLGLVRRQKNEENRREMLVYLSRAGRDTWLALESASFDVNRVATVGLSADEATELLSLLRRVAANLSANALSDKIVDANTLAVSQ